MNYKKIKKDLATLKNYGTDLNMFKKYMHSYNVYEYLRINYPKLLFTLELSQSRDFLKEKDEKAIFSEFLFNFCLLTEPLVSERIKKLINMEVELVNKILMFEPNWHYLSNYGFYNSMKDEDFYGSISFGEESYIVTPGSTIDFHESSKFYIENDELLKKLHSVVLSKIQLLQQVSLIENSTDNLDLEVLKIVASELNNLGGLRFLVKNKRINIFQNVKVKTKIKQFINSKK